jgi:hypothetical protein
MLPFLLIAIAFVFVGLLAHFVADQRGRPLWEPWIVSGVTALLSMACYAVVQIPVLVAVFAPLPPVMMYLFPKRGQAALAARAAPCPHCAGPFVVDRQFLGQSVTCPHCRKPFQLPAA